MIRLQFISYRPQVICACKLGAGPWDLKELLRWCLYAICRGLGSFISISRDFLLLNEVFR